MSPLPQPPSLKCKWVFNVNCERSLQLIKTHVLLLWREMLWNTKEEKFGVFLLIRGCFCELVINLILILVVKFQYFVKFLFRICFWEKKCFYQCEMCCFSKICHICKNFKWQKKAAFILWLKKVSSPHWHIFCN